MTDYQPMDPGGGFDLLSTLVMLLGMGSVVFWMVVGWRAMRAHEKLAESTAKMAAREGAAGR